MRWEAIARALFSHAGFAGGLARQGGHCLEDRGWWRILGGGCCCERTRQLEGSPSPCRNGHGYWHERLVLWKLSDSVWYVLTPDLDLYGEDLSCSGCEGPSKVKVKGVDFKYSSRVGITFWFGHGLGLGKSSALHTFELVYFHVIFHWLHILHVAWGHVDVVKFFFYLWSSCRNNAPAVKEHSCREFLSNARTVQRKPWEKDSQMEWTGHIYVFFCVYHPCFCWSNHLGLALNIPQPLKSQH